MANKKKEIVKRFIQDISEKAAKDSYASIGMPDTGRAVIAYEILHYKYDDEGNITRVYPLFRIFNYDKEDITKQSGLYDDIRIGLHEVDTTTNTTTDYWLKDVYTGMFISEVKVEEYIENTRIVYKRFDVDSTHSGKLYKYFLTIENIRHTNPDGNKYVYTITSDEIYCQFPTLPESEA